MFLDYQHGDNVVDYCRKIKAITIMSETTPNTTPGTAHKLKEARAYRIKRIIRPMVEMGYMGKPCLRLCYNTKPSYSSVCRPFGFLIGFRMVAIAS